RNQDTATGTHTMAQRLRQRVREGLIERNGKAYVAEEGCRISDFGFRWSWRRVGARRTRRKSEIRHRKSRVFGARSSGPPESDRAPRRTIPFPVCAELRRSHPDDAASIRNLPR